MPRGLLVDLDDTLYDYLPADLRGRNVVLGEIAQVLNLGMPEVEGFFREARTRVKARIPERGSCHSRLLYFAELVHCAQRPDALRYVSGWEDTFWRAYLEGSQLRDGARELLVSWRNAGNRTAIVTDQTTKVQLLKMKHFDLFDLVDVIVVSEELPNDKPTAFGMELAIERLHVSKADCVVVGDSDERDGGAARALGIPFLQAQSSEFPGRGGLSLREIAVRLGVV